MANPYRTSDDLRKLCQQVSSCLAQLPLLAHSVVKSPRSEISHSGWFCDVAKFPHAVRFSIFLDRNTGYPEKDVWCGFCATTKSVAQNLAGAAAVLLGDDPIIDNHERQLKVDEFGKLFLEHLGADGHYVGVYLPNRIRRVDWIVAFCTGVITRLGGDMEVALSDLSGLDAGLSLAPRTRTEVAARRGQQKFRKSLLDYYKCCCCVSGPLPEFLLEAAHIATVEGSDDHRLENGVLLRPDLHTLFDLGHLAFEPDSRVSLLSPDARALPQYAHLHLAPPCFHEGVEDIRDSTGLRKRLERLTWYARE